MVLHATISISRLTIWQVVLGGSHAFIGIGNEDGDVQLQNMRRYVQMLVLLPTMKYGPQ